MATTAIAILNYNGKDFIQKFLPILLQHNDSTPIYIGDNASTDQSVEFIKSKFPNIHLIELKENYGYSKGYNLLLQEIEADYIAIINSDIEVTSNWLAPLIRELDSDKQIAAVQPKIKSYLNKGDFEYAGAAGGYIDKYGYPFCRGRVFDTLEKDNGQYDDPINITWASGACFLIRKHAFNEVGGFDDDFFAHMEEIDLCWRLSNKNYSIRYVSESTVYHVGGGTLSYESPFKTFLNFRNGLYLLLKNLPQQQIRKRIILRVLLDWLSVLYFLIQGKWKQSKSILKAHQEVFRTKRKFLAKRKTTNNPNLVTENYSIVWKYFIERKRKFSEL